MGNSWKLKDVLLIAISAVLFGVIYLGCTYIGGIFYGLLTPVGMASLGYEPFYGIYFMAAAFGIYVMRKPGTGLIAELLAAVLECLYGNYFGPIIILSGLVQGLGFELIIALKGYKKYDRATMIEAAVVCSVVTMIYNLFISGYNQIAVPVLAIMMVVRIISAIIFCGIVTPILADGLAKAGVLKGYAVAGDVSEDLED
ncbi:MAG: ECF transporter S component [Oscillospiraceae bacterium]|nr:ECF transporter S component [Oscillospiraceae bacterium]